MKEEKKEVKKTPKKKDLDDLKVDVKIKEIEKVEPKKEEVREIIVEKKVGFNFLEVILIMLITLIIGGFLGYFTTNYVINPNPKTDSTESVLKEELREFLNLYQEIIDNFYEEIDEKGLINAGIEGMIKHLEDNYSIFMTKEESDVFNDHIEGSYTGIGVEIRQEKEGELVGIVTIFPNSPAERAGLKVGDLFLKIEGESVEGKNPNEIASIIKGMKKAEVEVTIKRNNKELTKVIAREKIELESVSSEIITKGNKKIGYIKVDIFANNTFKQFDKHLKDLEKEKIDSLIIDVRGNMGGFLSSVTDITSLFLEKGKVIYKLEQKGKVTDVLVETRGKRTYDIVVLTNQASASASEILAAALKESYGAKVVGTQTHGKGTVQRANTLQNGTTIKYTIQKWLTPKGTWVNEKGVEPTHKVEQKESFFKNPTKESDAQLQKALELLK